MLDSLSHLVGQGNAIGTLNPLAYTRGRLLEAWSALTVG